MQDSELPLVPESAGAGLVRAVRPDGMEAMLGAMPDAQRHFLQASGFTGASQTLVLLPEPNGRPTAVLGLGDDRSPFAFGDLASKLPEGIWQLAPADFDMSEAVLGFCLGAYHYGQFRKPKRAPARLVRPAGQGRAEASAAAAWMVRDLINTPASHQAPADLADAALALAARFGAAPFRCQGSALETEYPAVAAVGRGSARPPVVAGFSWRGSRARPDSPLIALCGKGVVFDTGGYDLKPSSAMLRMKKDMGGGATILGVARLLMERDIPARLLVRIGCVENSVSGHAMRPSDVIRTRRGLTVEIGNTDAEGRLVLADLLSEASDLAPTVLVDCATLTGAARVALGTDVPALFCSDDSLAARLLDAARRAHDPLWRLPLWQDYQNWLDSNVADLNNVSSKPTAGAIIAALFLSRFVGGESPRWAHVDLYAWNDQSRPGRPEGGEAQAMRALADAVEDDVSEMPQR